MRIAQETPLVLGSASPRRRELLALLRVPFVVRSASADETARVGEAAHAYVARVTLAKLAAVRALELPHAGGILVADTIVIAPGGAILGKPRDAAEARSMIERLAAATHEVATHFVLADASRESDRPPAHAQTVTTRVTFRALAPGEAERYVATGEGSDKAGAYAAQGGAAAFVDRIDGSFSSVVGLPLSHVAMALRALGWI